MVDVKELRVGNWVKLNRSGIHFQVKAVDESYSEGECSAIPLTPEMLEKCNLKTIQTIHIDGDYWTEIAFNHANGQDTSGVDEVWVYYNNALLVRCKHLHQLQNLYYALTGTELNYKP